MSSVPVRPTKPVQVGVPVQDYSKRKDPRERRPPVTDDEWNEEEGWAARMDKLVEEMEHNAITIKLTAEEVRDLPKMTQEQVQERIKVCPTITETCMYKYSNGKPIFKFVKDAQPIVQSIPENASELARSIEYSNDEIQARGYIPNKPSVADKRHPTENWEIDEARCKKEGLLLGLEHFGVRGEQGHGKQMPALTQESLPSGIHQVHKFSAFLEYNKNLAMNDQMIGQIFSVMEPEEYAQRRELMEFWEKNTWLGTVVRTPRQTCNMRANVKHVQVDPHWDSQPGTTISQVTGTYKGEEGAGMFYIQSIDKKIDFKPSRSLLFFDAKSNQHGVGAWTSGTRVCMTQYMTKEMYDKTNIKPPLYPEEISTQLAAAAQIDADNREANGEPREIDSCPFCKQAKKGYKGVNGHLSRVMTAKKTDHTHPLKEVAEWILHYGRREKVGKRNKPKSKGVIAAAEYFKENAAPDSGAGEIDSNQRQEESEPTPTADETSTSAQPSQPGQTTQVSVDNDPVSGEPKLPSSGEIQSPGLRAERPLVSVVDQSGIMGGNRVAADDRDQEQGDEDGQEEVQGQQPSKRPRI